MASRKLVLVGLAVIILGVALAGGTSFLSTFSSTPEIKPTKVRFILNFGAMDGHHAPYFVALQKGWYLDEGLDVEIIPGRNSPYAVEQVGAGNADIGLATADVIVSGRTRGVPVKAVYLIYQSSPAGVAAPVASGIRTPSNLVGKKIGALVGATQDLQFDILVQKLGIDRSRVEKVNTGFDVVAPLVTGKVDAIQMWVTNVPDYRDAGLNVTAFYFKDYGIDFYSLAIFSNDDYIRKNSDVVRKFVKATDRAIKWTTEHTGEAVDIVMKYTAYNLPKSRAQFYAKLEIALALTKPSPGTTLGGMKPDGWKEVQDLLLQFGKVKQAVPVNELYTNEFLPT